MSLFNHLLESNIRYTYRNYFQGAGNGAKANAYLSLTYFHTDLYFSQNRNTPTVANMFEAQL
jgi:hypothetical protein